MTFSEHFNDIECDMWAVLEKTKKPIVLYGMGDGADKIIAQLEKRNINVSGIFASDGFVPKGDKRFHGMKIESFAQIKQRLNNPVVLVCFGTKLDSVIDNVRAIMRECELYAPDVPVFGDGLFDMEYFQKNLSRLEKIYQMLYDEKSKNAFVCCLKYRLTGKPEYLFECETDESEGFSEIFSPKSGAVYIDVGAYNGDTIRAFSDCSGKNITVYAVEPDAKNFKKLQQYATKSGIDELKLYFGAAWSESCELSFYSRSGRNSAKTTAHTSAKQSIVKGIAIDEIAQKADFIKIDAEGSDKQALMGAKRLICQSHPRLCVAAYHRTEDYLEIPELVQSIFDGYKLMFRHSRHIPCWDTNFYFI